MGPRIAGAAALAVERVNAQKTLLLGRVLEYSWADSGCSAKQGLAAMGELQNGVSKIDAVVGPGCSAACEVTSHLSGGQSIPQISWGTNAWITHRTHALAHTHFGAHTYAPACTCCECMYMLYMHTSICAFSNFQVCMHAGAHDIKHAYTHPCACAPGVCARQTRTCTHTCTLLKVALRQLCLTRISTNWCV